MFNRVTYPVEILVLKFNLLSIRIFAFHLLTFILTLWYEMKIVPIKLFQQGLFIIICCPLQNDGTSGVSKIFRSFWCCLLLILQYYYIQKLQFVPFLFLIFFCMCVLLYIFFSSFSQALQLYATDQILYYRCLSQFSLCQWFRCLSQVWLWLK